MSEAMEYTRKYREMMIPVGGSREEMPHWATFFNDEMVDFWNGEVVWNAPMGDYTTFKTGGEAEAVVEPRGCNEISLLVQGLRKINVPWQIMGRGSNVLVSDKGLKGVVIILGREFSDIETVQADGNTVLVRVQAGCSLARLISWTQQEGLSGLEFATGIPGSVGGAIVMNAGAWKREIKDVLSMVTVMDSRGCFCITKTEEMNFSYRSWGEDRDKIVLEGFFRLKKMEQARVKRRCHEFHSRRKEIQPQNVASAGSFFKNPPQGKTAGQLIDEAGLKGFSVGGALVSPVHANFIVNTGNARATEIISLMHIVQENVLKKFGIKLEPEVKILGRDR